RSYFPPANTIPRHSRRKNSSVVESEICTNVMMADRTIEELLQAPSEGYGEAIVIPEILAENFEIKMNLVQESLQIIENKSKDRYSRSRSNIARVNTNSRDVVSKTDDRINKLDDQITNLVDIINKQVVAPAKAVEKVCFTCGGAHAYYECIATDSNPSSICAATGSYNQVSPPNRASHQIPPPGVASVQNNPNRFNQNQGQGNHFNQGNNFKGNNF
nr:hypothetical protein [Tanacetum cinerariifolium]